MGLLWQSMSTWGLVESSRFGRIKSRQRLGGLAQKADARPKLRCRRADVGRPKELKGKSNSEAKVTPTRPMDTSESEREIGTVVLPRVSRQFQRSAGQCVTSESGAKNARMAP